MTTKSEDKTIFEHIGDAAQEVAQGCKDAADDAAMGNGSQVGHENCAPNANRATTESISPEDEATESGKSNGDKSETKQEEVDRYQSMKDAALKAADTDPQNLEDRVEQLAK
mmetsp:Transcript_15/g.41  ORF Transcript_15/g.41 Transcript_15/m.41 type:complete len:112 (-) Transcript_15:709-1044(-)|eukprot:CAMPEP_0198734006 /NCGR_PEP_ID=MMETSP1475-20131203/49836_1 /TAXON_ID= ORGANISM="Unidentified sp., Strain CCMP1999" /NCGR_SAMPLE_ID=MMETSP1475 /ASSEMBLY_ACC=CAM_ASM_001111 /LENGTH=111 /DNA_ID=CAMNT_0044497407 /DNA_START=78 /DNA_END=413 /DNA_ORIENTATION=-